MSQQADDNGDISSLPLADPSANENGLRRFHGEETLRASLPADSFCSACFSFLSITQWQIGEGFGNESWTSKVFHPSLASLKDASAAGCHLCSLIDRQLTMKLFNPLSQESRIKETMSTQHSHNEGSKLTLSSLIFLGMYLHRGSPIFLDVCTQQSRDPALFYDTVTLHIEGKDRISNAVLQGIKKQRYFLQDSTSNGLTSRQIQEWIRLCASCHGLCKPLEAQSKELQLPTRLIDLHEMASHGLVRLIKSSTLHKGSRYATLSHRWAKSLTITLNDLTEASLSTGLRLDRLPLLFQDVSRLVLMLGLSYLWIDSLCIWEYYP